MKIGQHPIEIKPYDFEGKNAFVKRKTSVNINRVNELVSNMLSIGDGKIPSELEKMCQSILDSNDDGLKLALKMDAKQYQEKVDPSSIMESFKDLFDKTRDVQPDDLERIITFVYVYDGFYNRKYEKTLEYMQGLSYDFSSLMKDFSDIQGMDLDIDKIKKLIDSTPVNFIDGTQSKVVHVNPTGGGSSGDGNIYIGFDSFQSKEELMYVYFHELLHVMSSDYSRVIYDEGQDKPKRVLVSGVDFSGSFEDDSRGFTWLNEAFTDVFAVRMVNRINNEDVVDVRYKKELMLIDLLSEKGQINILTKISAVYFRYLEKREGTENPTDKWKAFSKEIDGIFGPRFLVKLDIFIGKNGINKAIEVIEKWEVGKANLEDLV